MPTVPELRKQANDLGIPHKGLRKAELEQAIRTGRPTVLTPESQARYLDGIRRGATYKDAAAYAGFHPATVNYWSQRLRQANPQINHDTGQLATYTDDGKQPDIPTLFAFFDDIQRSEAEAKLKRLARIEQAAADPKYWTADAWWLERKYPDEFGRRERREVTITYEQAREVLEAKVIELEAALEDDDDGQ